jgi:hypothetical protein
LAILKECQKQEWSGQYTPGNPFQTGRPKTRWEDDIKKDIRKLKVPNWRTLVQDRRRWKELVEKAKTLYKSCRAVRRRSKKKGIVMRDFILLLVYFD